MKRPDRPPDRRDHIAGDDPQGGQYQKDPGHNGEGADDEGGDVNGHKPRPGIGCAGGNGFVQIVDIALNGLGKTGDIPVGERVGILGLAVRAGAHEADQGILKGVIIFQKLLVGGGPYDVCLILGHLDVQPAFFLLDLPYDLNHRGVIGGDDVGQGQFVDIHDRLVDACQHGLADHVVVHDIGSICIYIVNAENGQDIGNQRHNPQEYDGEYEALLDAEFVFHVSPPYLAVTPSTILSS